MDTFETLNNMGLSPRKYAKLLEELRNNKEQKSHEFEGEGNHNPRGISSEPISEEERRSIRMKIRDQRKKRRRRLFIYFLFAFPISVVLLYTALKDFEFGFPDMNGTAVDIARQEKLKQDKFLFFLNDGDLWLQRARYHNAIYQYKKAIEIYPQEYTGYYWLAVAYSYQCQNEQKGCIEGKTIVEQLEIQFPHPEQIAKTRAIYEPWSSP